MGNFILIYFVITDIELSIDDTQICQITNNSKKIYKGIKEEGNGKLLYAQNKDYILRVMIFSCNLFLIKKHKQHL